MELAHIANMREEFPHWQQTAWVRILRFQCARTLLEKILYVAHEQIILVLIVRVKSRAPDPGSVQYVLHSDFIEVFFMHQRNERIPQCIPRSQDTAIHFHSRFRGLLAQLRGLYSL